MDCAIYADQLSHYDFLSHSNLIYFLIVDVQPRNDDRLHYVGCFVMESIQVIIAQTLGWSET